jgi:3-hydroxyisobutyrate dehydrogenase-like beta-hydroxyacid dehydrogenase
MTATVKHLAFIGFGEAARAFASGFRMSSDAQLTAYDIQHTEDIVVAAKALSTAFHTSCEAATQTSQAIFSVVTADQAYAAAETYQKNAKPNIFWFDCNSCSPGSKRKAFELLTAKAVRYVDVAVMAPVHPKLHRTPILISGPHAEAAHQFMSSLDMDVTIAGDKIGDASAIKMMRSIMIKGLEALTAECCLAARKAGVDAQVIASLQASDPGILWSKRSSYNLDRMMVHGKRRAAEMNEVVATLRELQLPARMAAATALWQEEVGALALNPGRDDLSERADSILNGFSK